MPSPATEAELLATWYEALADPLGLCISTDDRQKLRQFLYNARTESQDDRLRELVIIFPVEPDVLWIAHKDADGKPSRSTPRKGDIKLIPG